MISTKCWKDGDRAAGEEEAGGTVTSEGAEKGERE